MTKHKIQNKSLPCRQAGKCQISNNKTSVLVFVILIFNLFCALNFVICHSLYAEESVSSSELITKAWEAHGKKDAEAAFKYTQEYINLYGQRADEQQAALTALPKDRKEIEAVQTLNDVATAYFIQGESYRDRGKNEESINAFKTVVEKYYYAQGWDPRGWFWEIAKAAKDSIIKLEGGALEAPKMPEKIKVSQLPTEITLYDLGKETFIDYTKYGEFENIGTKDYRYNLKDQEGLSLAAGEGVYPNTTSIRWDPAYKKALKDKRLEGSHWDFTLSLDLEAAFFKWALAPEPQGVKLFYTGLILERAGLIEQAIKCYYAIVVHFPASYGWTYWHTPWYIGQAAIAKINFLLRENPALGYKLEGAQIKIVNGYDHDIPNDVAITTPGKFVKINPLEKLRPKPDLNLLSIKQRRGKGKVHVLQYETGDWQLIVEQKPYIIKAVTYAPTKIGQSPDNGTLTNWMEEAAPFTSFADKNRNNLRDKNEPAAGDFKLMKEMGINSIRLYQQPFKINKELLNRLYKDYGIRVIMGDFLGKYALGSGAAWNPGTDYTNEEQKKNMLESVTKMVLEHKDEPYVLLWLLGNENVYGYGCNGDKEPEAFFKFCNEAALAIKAIDPEHPVAVASGDTLFLDKFAKFCPDVDIFGTNAYRGNYGFGSIWQQVKEECDKPAFITEFGCPAHAGGKSVEEAEALQAEYHSNAWDDIEYNMAFKGASGNSLGGVIFEWLDEWWKAYEPFVHDTKGLFTGPFPDGYMHEEWLGICGQGDGKLSPLLRQLRQAYWMYKKRWR